ncbi:MAG: general secretion pathway protein GspE [Myxococcaceae bacterium]|nr:general secretion pathway protein GspE [Myxococcaceae bacterium]
MPRLGSLLLEEKLITQGQLEEGLETQVVYGGRLGTNLVELGFVKEPDLARVLGRLHNCAFAAGEMVPDPAALAVADADFYDDKDVLPMRVDATKLTVAITHPKQIEAIDALGFKSGKRVVQVVIPEFRMAQLLRKYAKAFRPMRPIDMNTLRPSKAMNAGDPKPTEVGDLINEGDFAALYAQAAAPVDEDVIEGAVIEDDVPVVTGAVVEPPVVAGRPAPPPPLSVPPPEPKPITFVEAQKLLSQSQNRDDIAQTVLRFARGKFRRALLLSVRGDLVTGWQGLGKGVKREGVQRIGLSLKEDNSVKMVRDLRSHFIGPMKKSPGMEVFYKLLGGAAPATAVMMPLLVRGKPVHILYVDNGPGQMTPPDIGELLIVSQAVSRSYDTLIKARQTGAVS